MFHSIIISEPAAIFSGILMGVIIFMVLGAMGLGHDARVWGAMIGATLVNIGVGATVNTIVVDVLALLIMRPVSALVGARLLGLLLS